MSDSKQHQLLRTASDSMLAVSLLALLTACSGGGESDGGIGISGGQKADPVVLDIPIAYVKRSIPADEDGDPVSDDMREPAAFHPGAELFVRDRGSPSAAARSITAGVFPTGERYDVKDLSASFDGSKLLFSMRAPAIENADADQQPKWNVWQYDFEAGQLQRLLTSDITAEGGDDIAPQYLADDRIVFSSTRQRRSKAMLLDEGKPQFAGLNENRNSEAFLLHVSDSDGSNIEQISFNQSHDLDPAILDDGRIVFSRWDNMGSHDNINLYTIHADGTNLQFLYGNHSHDGDSGNNNDGAEVQFLTARETEDGKLLAALRPYRTTHLGGDIVLIDSDNFTEHNQTTAAAQSMAGPGQVSAALKAVMTGGISPGGRFSAAFPLLDGTDRLLVSWSQCRLIDEGAKITPCALTDDINDPTLQEAPPLYGIWIYDLQEETQLPVVAPEEGALFTDIIALQPRAFSLQPEPVGFESSLAAENVGVLHIASVYDLDGVDSAEPNIATLADPVQTPASQRPARFLRLLKAVSIPDNDILNFDNSAFGRSSQQSMREILGYVPIEPDGSVKVKVPADVAFTISVLDADGRRIGERHQNWLQLRPGEQRECSGCHSADSTLPHGRANAEAPSVNFGALNPTIEFPNTAPALFADEIGETMAEVYARVNGVRSPTPDVIYVDEWTAHGVAGQEPDFSYLYTDLITSPPLETACAANFVSACRIVINYEEHIHPLWSIPRTAADIGDPIQDKTCNSCHNVVDATNSTRLPAAQLDLSDGPSTDNPDHFNSYRELLYRDNKLEIVTGALLDVLVERLDRDGNTVVDINGTPILFPVPVARSMSTAGSRASEDFFDLFDTSGSHAGWLQSAELRLLSEWLDIGGQYYNNPFDAPLN